MEEIDWLVTLAYPTNPLQRFTASITGRNWEEAFDNAVKMNPNFNVCSVVPYYIEDDNINLY